MNKRFWIICLVIDLGLLTLSVLGLSSLGMHEKGLRAERQQEFMEVARQISFDIKKKVDAFLQTEQSRFYTDYQPYYVPEVGSKEAALVPSPLANLYSNGFATGYFQLESDGQLVSPHFAERPTQKAQQAKKPADHSDYFKNVRENLLPSLTNGQTVATHRVEPTEHEQEEDQYRFSKIATTRGRRLQPSVIDTDFSDISKTENEQTIAKDQTAKGEDKQQLAFNSKSSKRRSVYPISSLKEEQQTTQTLRRDNYWVNTISNSAQTTQEPSPQANRAIQDYNMSRIGTEKRSRPQNSMQQTEQSLKEDNIAPSMMPGMIPGGGFAPKQAQSDSVPAQQQAEQTDTVQVRIEPFVPMTVAASNGNGNGLFAGQVFLLRHVQIESRHLVQGFQLNEDELLTQITQSAKALLRRGMGYEISKTERSDAAFSAILQFDFGEVVLNLLETEPGYIQAQVLRIRNWFFGILGVVWLAVLVAMAALWKNLHEQVALSRKKDDFISAVSHELRTPLTSIRMYTEMLEKDWVKTDDKRREYYTTMRQESERLTRLIENVLDFSRIQRGKKRYDFTIGDVNECISNVTETMQPYINQAGFILEQQFEVLPAFAFDRDAVIQIVINLVDNALKYAKSAQDKHIIIRTRKQKNYAIIEIEDHGPGISRSQQKKIFDAFYRCEDESTRQNTGTGLGLALVKRFAEAHAGFVEIANAKPTGALFRVGLASYS